MITVNEKSDHTFTVSFTDAAGASLTPASVRYRVDDVRSGDSLVPWTAVTPAESVEITVSGEHNAIIQSGKQFESKTLSVEATDSLGNVEFSELTYKVKNLQFV